MAPTHRRAGKDPICFYCQKAGHRASLCPIAKAKLSGACYTPQAEESEMVAKQQKFKDIFIKGERITALIDSGSLLTLVRRDLVPTSVIDYSRQQTIMCVYGSSHAYPTAELTVVIDEKPYLMTVGVVDKLPVAAILGWDLPVLLEVLLATKDSHCSTAASGPVLTRAQVKAGVGHDSQPAKEPEPDPFSNLDCSLFQGGT